MVNVLMPEVDLECLCRWWRRIGVQVITLGRRGTQRVFKLNIVGCLFFLIDLALLMWMDG